MNITPSFLAPTTYPSLDSNPGSLNTSQNDTPALNRKKRGVASRYELWPQNATIKISLIGMTEEQKKFTKKNICKWAPHINLKIQFTERSDGDIRIKADNTILGGHSAIGRNSAAGTGASMVIGFRDGNNADASGTILHEFGHALGLEHEHQHPNATLDFNLESIYQRAIKSDPTLTRDDVHYNVVEKLHHASVITSPYDAESIMHYKFSSEELNGGNAVPERNELSKEDIRFMSKLYPKGYCVPARHSGFGYYS